MSVEIEKSVEQKTERCYNCTVSPMSMCGFPLFGCDLCKKFGDGNGNLYSIHNPKTSKLVVNVNGVDKVFQHPPYDCLRCKDTKYAERDLFFEELVDRGYSDSCHLMPTVHIPCHLCSGMNKQEIEGESEKKKQLMYWEFSNQVEQLRKIKGQDQVDETGKSVIDLRYELSNLFNKFVLDMDL